MVISLPRDSNGVPGIGGTLNTDGATPVAIRVNPTNNALKVVDATTGSSFTAVNNVKDANRTPMLWGVSTADFTTRVYIAVDSNGNLLIDST